MHFTIWPGSNLDGTACVCFADYLTGDSSNQVDWWDHALTRGASEPENSSTGGGGTPSDPRHGRSALNNQVKSSQVVRQ